jgi:glucose-6-phosphate isomerase
MFSTNIKFKNFKIKKKTSNIKKDLKLLLQENNQVISSLTKYYKNSFNNKNLSKYKKFLNFRVIGMGGSTLGTQAIYDFLNFKIKKKFSFIDNLQPSKKK